MLADENAKCRVVFEKKATDIYGFLPLAARLPKLAITLKLERLGFSHLFNSNTGASFQLITGRVTDHVKLLKFTSLR